MSRAALPFTPMAVVFDMDGLMLDSERAIIACLAAAARKRGHDLPEMLWLSMVGHSEAVCRHLLDEAVGELARAQVLQRSHALYDAVVAAGVPHRPGIVEMLVQSWGGAVFLLPALPAELAQGSVQGVRVRNAGVLDLQWSAGRLQQVSLLAERGGAFNLVYQTHELKLDLRAGQRITAQLHDGQWRLA